MNSFSCRLMKAQTVGDTSSMEFMRGRRVFEINPEHPIIQNLNVRLRTRKIIYFPPLLFPSF